MHHARPSLFVAAALALAAAPLAASDIPDEPPPPASLASHGAALTGALLFDEPGDGALWALGSTRYKARFAADGATYYPYLGADAPRSEPLHLELVSATRGDTALELARPAPERAGTSVLYDRGALVELFELRPESIEQMFVVERLAGAGDLVLRVKIDTDLTALQAASGLRFENERGGATYSRAFAFDAGGVELPVDTTWHDGEVEIRVAAELLDAAELPLLIDPVIQTFGVTNDDEQLHTHSDVAYEALMDRFAVVWSRPFSATDSDVLMALYDSDGVQIGGSLVSVDLTTDCWTEPRVASNRSAGQFLTVARTSLFCNAVSMIEGRTRQAATNLQGAQFAVSDPTPEIRDHPDVGGNAEAVADTYYCVVWQHTSEGDRDLEYQLVRTDGTRLFGAAQGLALDAAQDERPAISNSCGRLPAVSQDWSVVWEHRSFGLADRDVWGARIHWNGAISSAPFEVDGTAFEDTNPQASSPLEGGGLARPYMVTWERSGGVDPDVWGAPLAGDQLLSPAVNLSLLEGGDFVTQHQTRPVVDSDGLSFTVAYREHFFGNPGNRNVYVSTFRLAGGVLAPIEVHVPTGISLFDQDRPAITTMHAPVGWTPPHPGRAMVTWEEQRPLDGTWAIEGALYECLEATAPGAPLCFGDGSSAACPCGNESAAPAGCLNTTGLGARLSAVGSTRVVLDDLQLVVEHGVPGQPGLFFQGNLVIGAGNGAAFGDGLRCCGQGVIRLQVLVVDPDGVASSTDPIAAEGGVAAGDTRCYQFWYRDPAGGGVCGEGFNLSNGYEVFWTL